MFYCIKIHTVLTLECIDLMNLFPFLDLPKLFYCNFKNKLKLVVEEFVRDLLVLNYKEAAVSKFFGCARLGHIMPYHGRLRLAVP